MQGSDRYAANCILPRQRITIVSNSDILDNARRTQHDDWLKRDNSAYTMKNHHCVHGCKVWRQLLQEGIRGSQMYGGTSRMAVYGTCRC